MKIISLGIMALCATILFMAASAGAGLINLSGAQSARNIAEIFVENERLVPELKLVEPRLRVERPNLFAGSINPYTRQLIPGPPKDKRVLYVELDYPFKIKPHRITFIPPLDAVGIPRAAIGFTAYHENVPVIDFRYLSEPAL